MIEPLDQLGLPHERFGGAADVLAEEISRVFDFVESVESEICVRGPRLDLALELLHECLALAIDRVQGLDTAMQLGCHVRDPARVASEAIGLDRHVKRERFGARGDFLAFIVKLPALVQLRDALVDLGAQLAHLLA